MFYKARESSLSPSAVMRLLLVVLLLIIESSTENLEKLTQRPKRGRFDHGGIACSWTGVATAGLYKTDEMTQDTITNKNKCRFMHP
jgi:hypothetical protein